MAAAPELLLTASHLLSVASLPDSCPCSGASHANLELARYSQTVKCSNKQEQECKSHLCLQSCSHAGFYAWT